MIDAKEKNAIAKEDVLRYLEAHPDFFESHPDCLQNLRLSHPSGRAVSLIEKQVSALRARNTELRHRLHDLLESARDNDRLFQYTKHLMLALLECDELGDLIDAILYSFDKEFGVEITRVVLLGEPRNLSNATFVTEAEFRSFFPEQLRGSGKHAGQVPSEAMDFVFGEKASKVGSSAVATLSFGRPLGLLAIGNRDPLYYRTHSGNLFLSHIAEVISRLVYRLL